MQGFKRLSKIGVILTALPIGLSLAACAVGIDRTTLAARLDRTRERPALVDVRTASEYEAGQLPGAVNIPVQTLPFNMSRVPAKDRSRDVVVYCAHGPRAGLAGFFLRLAGFSQVFHLEGDFRGWSRAGVPVVAETGS